MPDDRLDRRAFLGTLAALGISGRIISRTSLADDAKLDPIAIAQKVEELYSTCKSYRDTGQAVQIMRDASGKEAPIDDAKHRKITTAFVRPDKFRFEFDNHRGDKLIRNLIWMDGPTLKSWWDIRPGVQTPQSLQFALGAAAGVTESSSMTIPPLLLPGPLQRPHALSQGPGKLSLLEDEAIGKHACRRLHRKFEAVNFQTRKNFEILDTYWIDAETHAIRRVVKEMQLDEGRAIGTLDLIPEFDADIPVSELAFDPPDLKP